ncbi:uncharacterized protein LOC110459164 isoform X2 [Mizuhopecten yessoensis]|uniref:uncharacterized protein LOC110459164 isoform X2 n=1 Tax=Mizuhopecten yessoensis TaxID=6573 RepID=UPI000B459816|nr:uncharacterized protein LOC110459164 isoform X2 [Mizuhopecten yessoensis]
MPASIVPIVRTRDYSLKPVTGLRYGNFEGVVHLPPLAQGPRVGMQNFCLINNQQIYRKVTDWFQAWRPWQQCVLLCGIADRCTVRQLDMLATSLEPVKHRDFTTAHLLRYPSTSFRKLKSRQGKDNSRETLNDTLSDASDFYSEDLSELGTPEYQTLSPLKLYNDTESASSNDGITNYTPSLSPSVESDTAPKRQWGRYARLEVVHEHAVFNNPLKPPPVLPDVADYADKLSTAILDSVMGDLRKQRVAEEKMIKINRQKAKSKTMIPFQGGFSFPKGRKAQSMPNLNLSDVSKSFPQPAKVKSQIDKKSKVKVKRMKNGGLPQVSKGKSVTLAPISRSDFLWREHTRFSDISQISKRSVSFVRHQMFGRTTVSTPDFFSVEGVERSGEMQRGVRFSADPKSAVLGSLPVPLQSMYKGYKWWPVQPHEGMQYRRPSKSDLLSNYKQQLTEIYTWLGEWEDYEKINLLNVILKISSPDALNFLMSYIKQKLRDARDINRLSDKLLLFTFSHLKPKDICLAAQVCRRWRYLCATDSLWMVKCHELGVEEGIENMEDIVVKANINKMGIDWRLAYIELRRITSVTRMAKERADAEYEAERRRRREEAETTTDSRLDLSPVMELSQSVALLQAYNTMFHVHTETPSEFGSIPVSISQSPTPPPTEGAPGPGIEELEIKCGTMSTIKLDDQDRVVQWKKVERETSDLCSSVASEDLSQYRDYVFQSTEDQPVIRRNKLPYDWRRKQQAYSLGGPVDEDGDSLPRKDRVRSEDMQFQITRSETGVKFLTAKVTKKSPVKKRFEVQEKAYDIRTELRQASDLLGKTFPSMQLEWQKPSLDDRGSMKSMKSTMTKSSCMTGRYIGVVKSVRRVRKLQGHMNGVLCVQFDKRRLISAGLDRTVRVWDIRSGRSIHKLYGHKGGIRCLHFEENTLVTGSWDTTLIVWDLRSFEKRAIMAQHTGCVSCVTMNHEYIVSGSHDLSVRVWYRPVYQEYKVLRGHKGLINCVAFDGQNVVSGSSDMTLRLVNIHTEQCLYVFDGSQDQVLTVSIQGELILSGDLQGRVYFWNKMSGESEAAIQAHDKPIYRVNYHQGRFITASGDGTIREWDMMTMTSVRLLQGHQGPVRDARVSDDRIVSCSDDGTIRVWDLYDSRKQNGGGYTGNG